MSHVPPSETPAPDELVAYLDGELSSEACRRLEERLAVDDDLRQQLQELDRAWEALNSLPQPTVRDDFARTTIEMVAVAAQQDLFQRKSLAKTGARKRWMAAALVGVLAAACSFVAVRAMFPDKNRELVEDLPVIMQFDLLTQVPDVEFLRRLSQTVPLEQLVQNDDALKSDVEQIQWVSTQQPRARGPWIEQRTPEEKAALAAHADRFRERSDAEQLRALQREIAAADDAEVLQRTLVAYGQWLARRSPGEGAKLRGIPSIDERLREIERLVARDDRHAARQLSLEDARHLREEVYEIAEERKPEFLQQIRDRKIFEEMRQRGIRNPEERIEERDPRVARFIVGQALWNKKIDDRTRRRLVEQLSDSAQSHLEKLGQGGQNWQLIRWMREALEPRRGPEALERFFAETLDNDQRAALLGLPPGEMETQLERLYLTHQLGFRGREWSPGQGEAVEFGRVPGGTGPPGGGRGDRSRDGRRADDPPRRDERDRNRGDRDRRER